MLKSAARSNDFLYYYVAPPLHPGEDVQGLFSTSYKLPAETAARLINTLRAKQGKKPVMTKIVCVCIDLLTNRLYLPDTLSLRVFNENEKNRPAVQAVIKTFEKNTGESVALAAPVCGDPLDVFRIKSMEDFHSAVNFLIRNTKGLGVDYKLPVVEADLSQMPETAARIPAFSGEKVATVPGAYMGDAAGEVITFTIGQGAASKDVYSLKTPFILINTAAESAKDQSSRESIVVYLFKDHLLKTGSAALHNPDLFGYRYLLYSGWSVKDLCQYVFKENKFSDFAALMQAGARIIVAAKDLAAQNTNLVDQSSNFIYYTFKIEPSKFPIKFVPSPNEPVLTSSNGLKGFLEVVYFDPKTDLITMKSPLFFPDEIITRFFGAKDVDNLTRSHYDTEKKAVLMDKNPKPVYAASPSSFRAINESLKNDGIKPVSGTFHKFVEQQPIEAVYETKHISDYPEAYEYMQKLCQSFAKKNGTPVAFENLPIITGPFAQNGMNGGYISLKRNTEKNAAHIKGGRIEILKGLLWARLPCILIDTLKNKTVVERQNIIRHEYRHYINEELKISSPDYDVKPKENETEEDNTNRLLVYYSSPDEHDAFVEQCKYFIGLGMSKEQILRSLTNNQPINMAFLPIVKIIRGFIDEAEGQMKKETEESMAEVAKHFEEQNLKSKTDPVSDESADDGDIFDFGSVNFA